MLSVANEESYRGVLRQLRSRLVKLPKVDPPPDQPGPSKALIKLFTEATKEQKGKGHAYLGVDVVLRLLIDHVRTLSTRFASNPVVACAHRSAG